MTDARFVARMDVAKTDLGALLVVASPILLAVALFVAHSALTPIVPALIVASLFAFLFASRNRTKRAYVHVEATRDELSVGERRIARAKITRALLLPSKDGRRPTVRIEQKWGFPIELGVRDLDEGRELLRAMGFDATQTVTRFRALPLAAAHHWRGAKVMQQALPVMAVATALAARAFVAHSGPLFLAMIMLSILPAFVPTWIEVGADGVLVRWLNRRRFIEAGDIARVGTFEHVRGATNRNGVRLVLTNGETIEVPMRGTAEDASALAERIREATEGFSADDTTAAAALLHRGELSIGEWVKRLKGLGAGATVTLRSAAIDAERLWRLLESPATPPKERAAAAIALSTIDEEDKGPRIRVAASAIAEPRLRVAIEAAQEDDEAALVEALAKLEEDE